MPSNPYTVGSVYDPSYTGGGNTEIRTKADKKKSVKARGIKPPSSSPSAPAMGKTSTAPPKHSTPLDKMEATINDTLGMWGIPMTPSQAHIFAIDMQRMGVTNPKDAIPYLLLYGEQQRQNQLSQHSGSGSGNPYDAQRIFMQALMPEFQREDQQMAGLGKSLGSNLPHSSGFGSQLANSALGKARAGAGDMAIASTHAGQSALMYDQLLSSLSNNMAQQVRNYNMDQHLATSGTASGGGLSPILSLLQSGGGGFNPAALQAALGGG